MENKELELIDDIKNVDMDRTNPHIAEAIRAIQAERAGTSEIEWSDFSSHNKNISAATSK
ncbi:hypothetical protein [Candidatus Leptofilum sp.]|uniref:hypothetical protein n=1 Tax=Candidatus Leptofilum sp. TaxID=3241576 RepID=UPI003B5A27FD